jgi:hypothetical protein
MTLPDFPHVFGSSQSFQCLSSELCLGSVGYHWSRDLSHDYSIVLYVLPTQQPNIFYPFLYLLLLFNGL